MKILLPQLFDKIEDLQKDQYIIIAIDGRSGMGKSTLAHKISNHFQDSEIFHLDPFDLYLGNQSKEKVISELLEPMVNERKSKIIIVEGIFAISEEFRKYYDLTIWVDGPAKIGFERGLKRDVSLNGIDNSEKWETYWMPKEEIYISRECPQENADYLLDYLEINKSL